MKPRFDWKRVLFGARRRDVTRRLLFGLSGGAVAALAICVALVMSPAGPAAAQRAPASCSGFPEYALAAEANARSLTQMAWAPYRRAETGWEIYAPLIAEELQTECPPGTRGFAVALAGWQRLHDAPEADGQFRAEDFAALKVAMNSRRTTMRRAAGPAGGCPPPPPNLMLSTADEPESYGGKTIQLRREAMNAYRAMAAAARREAPELIEGDNLRIFSAYRSPEYDAARCARDRNCDGIRRARGCSPHRTGMVMDVYLGHAPGFGPDSTVDANRLFITRGAAYRWLVRNAPRFGFVNYPFEPWHWEFVGPAA